MKVLVTGGNRGLGLELVKNLNGTSISRADGIDITRDHKQIAEASLNYDVFINNAFDGPPQEDWANFAQTNVYMAVYDTWSAARKSGHIFNIGSVGMKTVVAPEPNLVENMVALSAGFNL
jgi:NAD(P)-dependent dehydrogenase (short-subunit alcohol dehydrogenase family)